MQKRQPIAGRPHFNVGWFGAVLLGLALLLAAGAGAWWQAARTAPQRAIRLQVLDAQQRSQSAALQGRLSSLEDQLGELQGRVLAMDALAGRVAQSAGLEYAAPELATAPPPESGVMDDIPSGTSPLVPLEQADQLSSRIDWLSRGVQRQEDTYALVDVALSRQAGLQASLPTHPPVSYPYRSSSFGWRRNPISGRHAMHEGLDFAAPRGTPIRAASGGVVVAARTVRGYGRMVEIDHGNGLSTRYAHAAQLLVRAGDIVQQGDLIARVGSTGRSTGAHVHFEVRMAGYPLDPTLFIRAGGPGQFAQAPPG